MTLDRGGMTGKASSRQHLHILKEPGYVAWIEQGRVEFCLAVSSLPVHWQAENVSTGKKVSAVNVASSYLPDSGLYVLNTVGQSVKISLFDK